MMRRRMIWGAIVMAWTLPSYADDSLDLAKRAASVLGIGQSGACAACHAVNSKSTMLRWGENANHVESCLDPSLNSSALEKLNCMTYTDPDRQADMSPYLFGFYAAALHLPEFQSLLVSAYGEEKAKVIDADLKNTSMMPLNNKPLTAGQFEDLRAWYKADMPHLNEILNIAPSPTTCEESVSPDFKTHLLEAARDNWSTRNQTKGMRMFACADAGCFGQKKDGKAIFPEVSSLTNQSSRSWKADSGSHLHILYETTVNTYYWVRSSADGRFVAYGGSPSGVIDLQSRLAASDATRVIPVDAYYDPAFFPDDSAFMFQGSGTGICQMSLLKDSRTKEVTFKEDACSKEGSPDIPLYQSVGASLDGADYVAATGSFHSDVGEGRDPGQGDRFLGDRESDESELRLYSILYDGQNWSRRDAQVFSTPWEIDWAMAPSNRLLLGRRLGVVDEETKHLGYNVYSIKRPSQAEPFEKIPMARICLDGAKGNFSFDDRFLVTYSYIKAEHYKALGYATPDDPEFKKILEAGSANVFLYDFWTQQTKALTHMGANEYAQFPHFRSDGWIYFEVYDSAQKRRLIMASDAAIVVKAAQPTE